MKRIEFLGAPGIGKTTIYCELMRQRKRQDKCLSIDEAKIAITKCYLRRHPHTINNISRLILLYAFCVTAVQKRLSESISQSMAKKALESRLESWMPFIEKCSFCLADCTKPPYYRFLLANWFLCQLNDVALVEAHNMDYKVIFDESLSQRSMGILPWNNPVDKKQVRDYFMLVPAPDAVVCMYAKPQYIYERVKARQQNRIIVQHKGLSDSELMERTKYAAEVVDNGLRVIKERGIPVIEVNACLPVDQIVEKIQQFIWKF